MRPFALTQTAKSDLRAIAIYTGERWGKDQRNLYIKQLDDAFRLLAENPLAGKDCDYYKTGLPQIPSR